MNQRLDRRTVLAQLGAAAAIASSPSAFGLSGAWAGPGALPNSGPGGRGQKKLRHGAIGCGGMGHSDLKQIASHPDVQIVALCDVDTAQIDKARELAPDAKAYQDYRVMLKEMKGEIDSVHVSTPDHMHAAIAMMAMSMGIHVYCQKPLTRTVAEARAMAKRAKASGVVTQMGIQNHSNANYAAAKALFEQGLIGQVHEVHVWSDRPAGWWAQGVERDAGADPVPKTLDWDLWLGIAPERPYKEGAYHRFQWRGREDFGTGAQGDMACHLMDPATWFLGLGHPTSIRSDGPTPNGESYPLWSRVHYEFEGNDLTTRGPVLLTWYDGGKLPPVDLLAEHGVTRDELPKNACLFVGTDGALVANPYDKPMLLPFDKFTNIDMPKPSGTNHWHQFVDACLGKGKTSAPFDYSAHLTEVALLGNVALRFPHETLRWNGKQMKFEGRPAADAHLVPTIRDGWSIDGM